MYDAASLHGKSNQTTTAIINALAMKEATHCFGALLLVAVFGAEVFGAIELWMFEARKLFRCDWASFEIDFDLVWLSRTDYVMTCCAALAVAPSTTGTS